MNEKQSKSDRSLELYSTASYKGCHLVILIFQAQAHCQVDTRTGLTTDFPIATSPTRPVLSLSPTSNSSPRWKSATLFYHPFHLEALLGQLPVLLFLAISTDHVASWKSQSREKEEKIRAKTCSNCEPVLHLEIQLPKFYFLGPEQKLCQNKRLQVRNPIARAYVNSVLYIPNLTQGHDLSHHPVPR